MIDTLKTLIEFPSVSGTDGIKEVLRQTLKICEQFGFRTKNCDDIIGWAEIGSGNDLMGILCHLDVVPAGEGWTYPPFSATIKDGKVYGRGVMDDKGPTVAVIYAMKDILESGKPLNKRVRVIFGCQEETGIWDDIEYYKAHEEIPDFGFTPDADFPAIYGEKGILLLELIMDADKSGFLKVEGGEAANMVADWAGAVLEDGTVIETQGIAAHGSTPDEGENAITKLMEKAQDSSRFAKFYMDKIGWSLNGERFNCPLCDDVSGKLTLNAGQITINDDKVCLKIDVRYPITYSEKTVLKALRDECDEYGVCVKLTAGLKPVYMEKDGAVIKKLMEAYREVTGDMTQPQVMGGGTYARAMDNIVSFGPVLPGRECTEHKKDEWIYLKDLETAREIYGAAIEKLACKEVL